MNKENQELKCNFCDAVIKYRQSKHKHSLPCRKGGGEVEIFLFEGCLKEFTRKDVLLKRQRKRCRGQEKEKENVYSTCGREFSKKANLIRHKKIYQTQNYAHNLCKKSFKFKDHFEKHTCYSVATKRNSVQKKKPKSLDFSEETTFDLEKAYDTCMRNGFQELSFSLSESSMAFTEKVVI